MPSPGHKESIYQYMTPPCCQEVIIFHSSTPVHHAGKYFCLIEEAGIVVWHNSSGSDAITGWSSKHSCSLTYTGLSKQPSRTIPPIPNSEVKASGNQSLTRHSDVTRRSSQCHHQNINHIYCYDWCDNPWLHKHRSGSGQNHPYNC